MKHVLVINPVSGQQDVSGIVIPQFKEAVNGQSFAIEITKSHGHAAQIAEKYASAGEEVRLYACGGDGTLNEVLRGCYAYKNAEAASLPFGSGNDFIRNFGTKAEFQNIADAVRGTAVTIDLMRVNDGISAAISSAGIDANVAYGIPAFRRLPFCGGQTAYNLSIIKCLCGHIGRKMIVEIDGEVLHDELLIATVCNGSTYGGGYLAAPCADLTDGLLEVILVKKISRLRIAKVLAMYKKGAHIENLKVTEKLADIMQFRRAKAVKIVPEDGKPFIINIDGECEPKHELNIEIMPQSARFVLPQPVLARFKQTAAAL